MDNFCIEKYWDNRYKVGHSSGAGSYGVLGQYKIETINNIIQTKNIKNIIDFGCGDGHIASFIKVPQYLGLDVSKVVIDNCIEKFKDDDTKKFLTYDPETFKTNNFKANMTISLDVLYHLTDDRIFDLYIKHLFSCARQHTLIYSTNEESDRIHHIRHRKFTDSIPQGWFLKNFLQNPFSQLSKSNFFLYEKSKH